MQPFPLHQASTQAPHPGALLRKQTPSPPCTSAENDARSPREQITDERTGQNTQRKHHLPLLTREREPQAEPPVAELRNPPHSSDSPAVPQHGQHLPPKTTAGIARCRGNRARPGHRAPQQPNRQPGHSPCQPGRERPLPMPAPLPAPAAGHLTTSICRGNTALTRLV